MKVLLTPILTGLSLGFLQSPRPHVWLRGFHGRAICKDVEILRNFSVGTSFLAIDGANASSRHYHSNQVPYSRHLALPSSFPRTLSLNQPDSVLKAMTQASRRFGRVSVRISCYLRHQLCAAIP